MKRLFPLAISLLLISCSTYYGNLTGNTYMNQKIETTAFGTSSAKYVLGIGGNNKSALVLEAKTTYIKTFRLNPIRTTLTSLLILKIHSIFCLLHKK